MVVEDWERVNEARRIPDKIDTECGTGMSEQSANGNNGGSDWAYAK